MIAVEKTHHNIDIHNIMPYMMWYTYVHTYSMCKHVLCGMLHGQLRRENSAHFSDVHTLHLMLHCG